MSVVALSVCLRCGVSERGEADAWRPGAVLAEHIAASLADVAPVHPVALRTIRCMSQCTRPCVVAFSGDRRFTYLFGDLNPDRHAPAVLETLHLYLAVPDGFMERTERPEAMRGGVLARLPPLGSTHAVIDGVQAFFPRLTGTAS